MRVFPNVIGALDGSHMNLFEAPSKPNKDVYFTKKRRYAIHLQAVLFEDNDYILADSAYPISLNIIPLFKNPSDSRQTAFNKKHKLRTKNTKIATDLIETSLILHNLLEKDGDEWEESSERVIMYRIQYDNTNNSRKYQAIKEAGKIKRQSLMDYVLS
ncbi:9115_t:CDS:2 [Gigaspora rosea]|nr:9115_t:CDS:2 [Gigaspora rosea]